MTAETLTRILVRQRDELGDRVADAIANENASAFNTEWEIDGRFIDASQRLMDEFREIVAQLEEAVA